MPSAIRSATFTDARILAEFNCAMAWETEEMKLDPGRVLAGVRAVLEEPAKGFYLVAAIEGRVVGQLMITYEWSDWRNGVFWWIQSVYVEPGSRGQGVFRALYETVLERARADEGICGVRLYVEGDNHRARQTYEALGMTRSAYRIYEVDFVLGTSPDE